MPFTVPVPETVFRWESNTLAYDNVDQLVSSSSSGNNGFVPYNRNFTYDLLGNRTNDSVNGAGSFVSNFLTQNGVSNYQADPDGFGDLAQEVGITTKNYSYRADGRLNSFSSSAVQANYYYDALGRRVAKAITKPSENFTQSYLHVLQADRILQAKAGDGSITTYLDGSGVDQHLGEVKGGVAKGYVTDHLGSVLNSDVAGASNQFGLFGEVENNPTISSTSSPVMYGFTGREWDAESATNYHRARNYQPETGRWLSQDPIGLNGDHKNLYRYSGNSPVVNYDRNGLRYIPIVQANEVLVGAGIGALGGGGALLLGVSGGTAAAIGICVGATYLLYRAYTNLPEIINNNNFDVSSFNSSNSIINSTISNTSNFSVDDYSTNSIGYSYKGFEESNSTYIDYDYSNGINIEESNSSSYYSIDYVV